MGRRGRLLKDCYPELAEQLVDASLLESLTCDSGLSVAWRGSCGHVWEARPTNRTRHGSGCPYCSNRKVLVGYNDLATTHSELAAQLADPQIAKSVTGGSRRRLVWVCSEGHSWVASVQSRVRGTGCPYCSNNKVLVGFNDLVTTHPDLAAELVNQTLGFVLTAGSNKKVEWSCSLGHTWFATPNNRVQQKQGCPYCVNNKVLVGFNDLATTHPNLATQLCDESLATQVTAGSSQKVDWRCDLGHVWTATPSHRVHGSGCPYCSNRKVLAGFNDLVTTHPALADELVDGNQGYLLTAGSASTVLWQCTLGHQWKTSVYSRTASGTGCPYCSNNKVLPGFNDIATTDPDLTASLIDSNLSTQLTRGSTRIVSWQCEHGHIWEASVNARRRCGCPVCSGRRVVQGINDIATTHPKLASELVDLSLARQVGFGSGRRVRWRCEHGHEWETRVADRCGSSATGCPVCARGSVSNMELDFVNELLAHLPENTIVMQHDRSLIGPKELDIVLPEYKLAIEFNGVYWHSEAVSCSRFNHASKCIACANVGYRLLFIWSDDWLQHREAVLHTVLSCLGVYSGERVYARNTQFREIATSVARTFLDRYHLQGFVSASHHYGLFDGVGDLVAVLSVRSSLQNVRTHRAAGVWEIQRYATCKSVVGGFSKLLKHAEQALLSSGSCLVQWVTFSANDISEGRLYRTCGFVCDKQLAPDYKYAGDKTNWVRKPKESFQKKRFKNDPDLLWEDGWTESQAAAANNLYKCWDSGKKRWVKDVVR